MKDTSLIEDITHVDVTDNVPAIVTDNTPAVVTYNFDRSVEAFIKIFRESYTAPDGTFFVEPACKALNNLSEAIMNNRDGVVLFDSQDGIHNVMSIIHEYPTVITTFESDPLMDLFGKYMARNDISKPNGDFNPISIFNCAKDDFGIDLADSIPIPFVSDSKKAEMIADFLNKM